MNKKIVMDFLEQANSNGKTVVIVTHDTDVSKICNRIINESVNNFVL